MISDVAELAVLGVLGEETSAMVAGTEAVVVLDSEINARAAVGRVELGRRAFRRAADRRLGIVVRELVLEGGGIKVAGGRGGR